jgi:hypothetical protein
MTRELAMKLLKISRVLGQQHALTTAGVREVPSILLTCERRAHVSRNLDIVTRFNE